MPEINKDKRTQKEIVLQHLQLGMEITPRDAVFPPYNTQYLASIIRDLRDEGYPIASIRYPEQNYNTYFMRVVKGNAA